jgi:hypothetical protein
MVVNLRAREISRGARKLARTPTLNLKKKIEGPTEISAHKFTICVLRSFALPDHRGSTSSCKLTLHQAPYNCILTSCHKCFYIILVFASLLKDKNLLGSPVMCQKRHDENFEFQMCSKTGFKFTCLSSLKRMSNLSCLFSNLQERFTLTTLILGDNKKKC